MFSVISLPSSLSSQLLQLNAVIGELLRLIENSGRIAYLSQFHQPLQDGQLRPIDALLLYYAEYLIPVIVAISVVNVSLILIHFAIEDGLHFFRKILGYLLLCSSQDERK